MTAKNLLNSFDAWRRQGQTLVLASVFETAGSTYSKTGARMLINADGDFQGMLSGGCLEGDLAERARQVIRSEDAQTVTYDLGLNDDELWGLGVGCDGLMKIFLQPLLPKNDYAPFGAIARAYEGDHPEVAATVLESDNGAIEPGATLVTANDAVEAFGLTDELADHLLREARSALADAVSSTRELWIGGTRASVLLAIIVPRPRLLVLGAGLDAEPLTRLADELGWRITVVDHRPSYIDNGSFRAEQIICCPAAEMCAVVDLAKFDMTIIMSHHLASDRSYLTQLASSGIQYIGLLGPKGRRRRLLEDLGDDAASLHGRLHGPAGIDIGAVGPAAIAVSILAEMQAFVAAGGSPR
jgi:xanthine/CO dehydrogenase XdhC/CoxF family maturation factor